MISGLVLQDLGYLNHSILLLFLGSQNNPYRNVHSLAKIDEKLANELPNTNLTHNNVHVSTIAPCVMNIDLSYEGIISSMAKLKADKAAGLDSVAPTLFKDCW